MDVVNLSLSRQAAPRENLQKLDITCPMRNHRIINPGLPGLAPDNLDSFDALALLRMSIMPLLPCLCP